MPTTADVLERLTRINANERAERGPTSSIVLAAANIALAGAADRLLALVGPNINPVVLDRRILDDLQAALAATLEAGDDYIDDTTGWDQ